MKSTPLSKIVPPTLLAPILHRESLIAQLYNIVTTGQVASKEDTTSYKLILLCAPAGYGKTTLLTDFARYTMIPCCWYFLNQSDADRFTFLRTLLASIRHRFSGFGMELDALLTRETEVSNSTHDLDRFKAYIDAFTVALETDISEPFVIVLCNYHEVNENVTINHIINQLLRQLPAHVTMIIESRVTPSLEMASPLARHQTISWGRNILRVHAEEIQELAQIQGVTTLSISEAEQLATVFDGWITGILLGTRLGDAALLHTGTRTSTIQGLPSMRIGREHLFAYLVEEIFLRQPAIYAFLKEATILEHMKASLCDELLHISNSSEYLEQLVRQGMFVSCSDDGPQLVYSCHPVLRELLCDELQRTSPERFIELHQCASALFENAHEYENAIAHALIVKDSDRAAQLILLAYKQMFNRQHAETILRWIRTLPSETGQRYPRLLLIQASIYLMNNNYSDANPLLDRVTNIIRTGSSVVLDVIDLPRLQAELMILRSKALFQEGKYQESQLVCEQAIVLVPVEEEVQQAEAHMYIGMCCTILGKTISGIEHLQKALYLRGRNIIQVQTAETCSALSNAYEMMGQFALAEYHISCAIQCYEQLHDEKGKANSLIHMGVSKRCQGALAEAEQLLHQSLVIASNRPGFEREESYSLSNIGDVYQMQGRYREALQSLGQGLRLSRQLKDNYLTNCCLCYLARTYLSMGDSTTALLLLSELNLPTTSDNKIGIERAIYGVTYGSVLLHMHRYDEAYAFLETLESALQLANIKSRLPVVQLYLAACQLAQHKEIEALFSLNKLVCILNGHDFRELVVLELKNLPELYLLVRTSPVLEQLRTLLHIEGRVQQTKDTVCLASIPSASCSTIKIQAFGEPTVFVNEQPVTRWRMARAMELFFFLLNAERPMRKEHILTALWTEDEPDEHTLHSTIYYLRKALGDACIISQRGLYTLNLSSLYSEQVFYDVAAFQNHHREVKYALSNNDESTAKTSLLAMVDLYRGEYVQPFYSDWCSLPREVLRTAYLDARYSLAQLAWNCENWEESIAHWQHLLAVDNCREEAHYGLMRCYVQQGRRSLAVKQYQRCKDILQQELGVLPGATLQTLYERLTTSV